jgi:hypothetical protein
MYLKMTPATRCLLALLGLGFLTAESLSFCPWAKCGRGGGRCGTILFDSDVEMGAEAAVPLQLDRATELALRTALTRMDRLMKSSSEDNDNHDLLRFIQQCAMNCQTAPSSIANAGTGLVAKRNIKQGSIINLYPAHCLGLDFGDYSPRIYADADAKYWEEEGDRQDYLLNVIGSRPLSLLPAFVDIGGLFMDVNPNNPDIPGWLSHYVNDGATIQMNSEDGVLEYYRQSAKARNCVLVPFGPSPLMATVATKKIRKGQEFFTSYGCMYWLEQLLGDQEECTEITDAIQEEAKVAATVLYQAMKGVEVTCKAATEVVQESFEKDGR